MGLFHRKSNGEKTKENNDLISENQRSVDALIVLADEANDTELSAEFKALKEKLKYLIPSEDERVRDFDKKIKNAIDDLRIELVKSDGKMNEKAKKMLTQIKLLIADRNAKV